jgi:MYND finger
MDKRTCTFIGDLFFYNGCENVKVEKIVHVDLFFPDCLPEPLKDRSKSSLSWLQDSVLRQQCILETISGFTFDGKPSPIDMNYFSQGLTRKAAWSCGLFQEGSPYSRLVEKLIDELENDDYFVGIHYCVRSNSQEEDIVQGCCGPGLKEAKMLATTKKFRRPKLIKAGGDHKGYRLDRKQCSQCGKDEIVTGTFPTCSICKATYYCCKECQRAHWNHGGHKKDCSK